MARKGYRRPVWPAFVYKSLSQADIAQLEREYDDFKSSRRLPRSTRVSAEDVATWVVDRAIAKGQSESPNGRH